MRLTLCVMVCLGMAGVATAQEPSVPQRGGPPPVAESLTGKWQVTAQFQGTTMYAPLQLEQTGTKLTGNFHGDKLEGTVDGGKVHFVAKSQRTESDEVTATVANGEMKGEAVISDSAKRGHVARIPFTATLVRELVRGSETHEFVPTVFSRSWSPANAPVLRVKPGDTIHTTTVDAGGQDENGVRRVMGGNPETGPFYIEGAQPGDTLVVHI